MEKTRQGTYSWALRGSPAVERDLSAAAAEPASDWWKQYTTEGTPARERETPATPPAQEWWGKYAEDAMDVSPWPQGAGPMSISSPPPTLSDLQRTVDIPYIPGMSGLGPVFPQGSAPAGGLRSMPDISPYRSASLKSGQGQGQSSRLTKTAQPSYGTIPAGLESPGAQSWPSTSPSETVRFGTEEADLINAAVADIAMALNPGAALNAAGLKELSVPEFDAVLDGASAMVRGDAGVQYMRELVQMAHESSSALVSFQIHGDYRATFEMLLSEAVPDLKLPKLRFARARVREERTATYVVTQAQGMDRLEAVACTIGYFPFSRDLNTAEGRAALADSTKHLLGTFQYALRKRNPALYKSDVYRMNLLAFRAVANRAVEEREGSQRSLPPSSRSPASLSQPSASPSSSRPSSYPSPAASASGSAPPRSGGGPVGRAARGGGLFNMKGSQGTSPHEMATSEIPATWMCPVFRKYALVAFLGKGVQGAVVKVVTGLTSTGVEAYAVKMSLLKHPSAPTDPAYSEVLVSAALASALPEASRVSALANFVKLYDWAKCRTNVREELLQALGKGAVEAMRAAGDPPSGAWWEKESDVQFSIQEFVNGPTLGSILSGQHTKGLPLSRCISTAWLMPMLVQVLGFLAGFNRRGGCHYDLHTDNILTQKLESWPRFAALCYSVEQGGACVYSRPEASSCLLFKVSDFGFARVRARPNDPTSLIRSLVNEHYGMACEYNPSHDLHKLGCSLLRHVLHAFSRDKIDPYNSRVALWVIGEMIHKRWEGQIVGTLTREVCVSVSGLAASIVAALTKDEPSNDAMRVRLKRLIEKSGIPDLTRARARSADSAIREAAQAIGTLGLMYFTYDERVDPTPASMLQGELFSAFRCESRASMIAETRAHGWKLLCMDLESLGETME